MRFQRLERLELAKQQQDDQHHQNDAAKAHPGVAVAVAVTAEPATEAAQQEDNQDDDKYHSERHGILPKPARANRARPAPPLEEKHIRRVGSSQGTPRSISAAVSAPPNRCNSAVRSRRARRRTRA